MAHPDERKLKGKLKVDGTYDLKLILDEALRNLEPIYKSCLNCEHFKEKEELCKLANARPPARVIAYSCERWNDYDEIPF